MSDEASVDALISVIVCTRNRGAQIRETIASVLQNNYAPFELLVVDQSDNEETAAVLRPFNDDPRFRYLPSKTVGKGRALHVGLQDAAGDLVALTDDDCTVPVNWLPHIARFFNRHSRAALMFMDVTPAEHDPQIGFIPSCHFPRSRIVTEPRQIPWGMGAAMAGRRSIILALGGFDEMLGPGGPYHSGEDTDLMLRMLLRGYDIGESNQVAVIHDGFRTWEQGRRLMQRDWFALGAVYAKLFKSRQYPVTWFVLHEIGSKLFWPPLRDLFRERRLRGWVPLRAFVRGWQRGWRTPVDPQYLLFAPHPAGGTNEQVSVP